MFTPYEMKVSRMVFSQSFLISFNWSGALIPWKFIELPNGELGAPTNDMCDLKLSFIFMYLIYKFFQSVIF